MSENNNKNVSIDLEARIDEKIKRIRRNRNITILLAILFLVTFCGYFSLLTAEMTTLAEPEDVANIISVQVFDFLLSVVETYGKQAISIAPDFANGTVKDLVSRIPSFRNEVQIHIISWAEEILDSMEEVLDRFVNLVYHHHKSDISIFLKTIQTREGKKGFEDFLVNMIATPLATDQAKLELNNISEFISIMDKKIKRIANDHDLSEEEKVEREILFSSKELFERKKQ
ncbi:MAG: hypothetical protein HQM08_09920 [Candidatus Riflebacteria bacterium]|nr:hypothetical protein [Candidatus Riflebacteria bacterium]